jgi:mono/diheme cytochrome c family protein/Cu/Ag efflux protein CusF
MKISVRSLKLSVLGLLVVGLVATLLSGQLTGIFAHEGHKKGHAPATAKRLRNPLQRNTQNIGNGRALYQVNCQGCHAADGKGAEFNRQSKIKVPDLTSHYVTKLADGEIFHIITHGIASSGMPAYRAKMTDRERWQLVHYVRHLSLKMEAQDLASRNSLTDEGFSTNPRSSNPLTPSRASNQLERSLLRGRIIRLDPDINRVKITHEAVDGLMGGMTMTFLVRNPAELAPFKPGDRVEADLVSDSESGETWLERFRLRKRTKK